MNHVQQSSTQESPSIVILGAREWKIDLLAIWQGEFIRRVLFLGWELRELVGGFIGERYARWCSRVWSGGDGAGATW
jgi:hypothetical protein